MLLNDIRALWPLSKTYEWAAEIGLAIRQECPGWWKEFEEKTELDQHTLPQAAGYNFLRWLERHPELVTVEGRAELAETIASALLHASEPMREEIKASLECLSRPAGDIDDPFPPDELSGQEVTLYTAQDCWGYPNGATSYLDEWTEEALEGAHVVRKDSEPASFSQLARVHSPYYLEGLARLADSGGGLITPETLVTPLAMKAVCAASGTLIAATKDALQGLQGIPLCLVRPGSHHATRLRGGGTCLVNNIAVACIQALNWRQIRKAAIIDLDAHHGNGTEAIFYEDQRVFTLSIHQRPPFFPGTGHKDDLGQGQGRGFNLNLPVGPDDDWLGTLETGLLKVQRHEPDIIYVELSTDAHRADPVSDLHLSDRDYGQAVHMIESLRAPSVYELGASTSKRAWVGGVRATILAAAGPRSF